MSRSLTADSFALRFGQTALVGGLAGIGLGVGAVGGAFLLSGTAHQPLSPATALVGIGAVLVAAGGIAGAIAVASYHWRAGLLGRAADASPLMEFMTDRAGGRIAANLRADTVLRGTLRPIDHLTHLIDPEDQASRQEIQRLAAHARAGRAARGEIRVRLGSEEPSYLAVHVTPVIRQRTASLWSIADVTTERLLASIAARERALLDRTLDRLPLGLFSLDASGRFLWANSVFATALGTTSEVLVGERHRIATYLAADPRGGRTAFDPTVPVERGEIVLVHRDGRPVRFALTQTVDTEGGESRTATVVREIEPRGAAGPGSAGAARGRPWSVQGAAPSGIAGSLLERFFEIAPVGIGMVDGDDRFATANPVLETLLAGAGQSLAGRALPDFLIEADRAAVAERLARVRMGEVVSRPLEARLVGAQERTIALFAGRIDAAEDAFAGIASAEAGAGTGEVILYFIDLTEQKNLELQFSQSQKMQAVGQLAGGVAHDFNNLLTAMIGFCDLLLLRFRPGDQSFADIMQIKQNANRAANLVRQLLAFSRRQTLQPRVIDVTEVLSELRHLLNRLLGEGIELDLVHARDLGPVKVDPGQLEQVIINLAVNARDAMPGGGKLSIRTLDVTLTEPSSQGEEIVPPGAYVLIEVSDTGTGIPPEIIGRIYEPFFSTKEVGSGTGLGLSTVYGIVKQTGGFIHVHSAMGAGTRFSIHLPRHQEAPKPAAMVPQIEAPRDLTGAGTVLLVEDEAPVRMFSARALRNKGYTVLEAKSGDAALEVLESAADTIDLVITDVVMPRMDGPTLIRHVRERLPRVKVIFISGYTEDALARRIADSENVSFLPKPFSLAQLAERVKEVLAQVVA